MGIEIGLSPKISIDPRLEFQTGRGQCDKCGRHSFMRIRINNKFVCIKCYIEFDGNNNA